MKIDFLRLMEGPLTEEKKKEFYPFVEVMMQNKCALKEVETKLQVLDEEFSALNDRNPIQSINSRIKAPLSILEKLERKGLEPTVGNMTKYLNDIAGVRVVCSFTEDIYMLADMLMKQDDIVLVERKDYIEHPKDNGYRSLHLILDIPVFLSSEKKVMRVEVQFRTIAMDFWASLEHQLKYKKKIDNPEEIAMELKYCADIITEMDIKMQNIRAMIEQEQTKHII
ncbi:MAG: GTP pyrophosphokinase family protein [Lachnospiraceae bacterium]